MQRFQLVVYWCIRISYIDAPNGERRLIKSLLGMTRIQLLLHSLFILATHTVSRGGHRMLATCHPACHQHDHSARQRKHDLAGIAFQTSTPNLNPITLQGARLEDVNGGLVDGADDNAPCVDGVAHCAHHDRGRVSVQAACGIILHAGRTSMNHRQQHLITFISGVPGLAFLGSSRQNSSHCQPAFSSWPQSQFHSFSGMVLCSPALGASAQCTGNTLSCSVTAP